MFTGPADELRPRKEALERGIVEARGEWALAGGSRASSGDFLPSR